MPAAKTKSKSKNSLKTTGFAFPPDTMKFLAELKANNNREWFTDNKTRYDLMVKQPAADFCDQMVLALEKLTGEAHQSKVFRVHRDIRFSKDKTPYKAYLHMLFQPARLKNGPKWFVGLEPDKLVLGAGVFAFEKEALAAYRQRASGPHGRSLGRQLDKMRSAGLRIRDPELKRAPSGYNADHGYGDLLRHKGLTAWMDHPGGPKAASKSTIVKTTTAGLRQLKPLFDWLHELEHEPR